MRAKEAKRKIVYKWTKITEIPENILISKYYRCLQYGEDYYRTSDIVD